MTLQKIIQATGKIKSPSYVIEENKEIIRIKTKKQVPKLKI